MRLAMVCRRAAQAFSTALLLFAGHAGGQTDYQQLRSLGAAGSVGTNAFPPVVEAVNGLLYGTTRAGGTGNRGVVYRMNPDGGGYADLKQFATDLEGVDPVGGVTDGRDGFLYGTTLGGGAQGRGVIFRLAHDGGGFTALYSFITNRAGAGTPDPGSSFAQLLEGGDGFLYGVGSIGGSVNRGGVFRAAKDGAAFTTLHSFLVGQGRTPTAALFPGQDGKLYGVTEAGGASDSGTLFRLNRDGTGFETLRVFAGGIDGAQPSSSVLRLADGTLYGTTFNGGQNSLGLLYRFQPSGPTYTVLRHFGAAGDGRRPTGGLVAAVDGFLLGVTRFGGTAPVGQQFGTLFKVRPDGTGYQLLRSFSGTGGDGSTPAAQLSAGADQKYFGTTSVGGGANAGTVFSLVVPTIPVITAQPQSRTNVVGTDAGFAVTAVGPGVLAYRWQFEEQDIANANVASLNVASVQLNVAGNYRVIVTNSYGGVTSSVAVLTVVLPNNPPVVANPIPDGTGTYGAPYSFTVAANTFSDPDAGQVFAYSAAGMPPGVTFNGATRSFSGAPSSAVSTFQVTVTAIDNGLPPLQVSDTFALAVGKAPLLAQANNHNRTYGSPNPPLTVSYTGFVFGQTPAILSSRPVASTTAGSASPLGPYSINLAGGTDDQYQLSLAGGTLTVVRAPLTVIAHNARRPFGQANPVLTGSLAGVAANDQISVSFTSTATTGSPAGGYPITPVLADPGGRLGNYVVTTNVAVLTVESPTVAPPQDIALTIEQTTAQSVQLSWPDSAAGFLLERRNALATDSFWNLVAKPPGLTGGEYRLALALEEGNDYFRLRYEPGIDPPPGTGYEAAAPESGVVSLLGDSTSFLYTGPNAVQLGVAPGTISRQRAAVIRGKVTSRTGAPLAGVQMTILNHPEYGSTASRSDGWFDLAVNGGGPLTVSYQKTGFLPVQRQAQVPWQDFALVDGVVMIPLDPVVTSVTLGAGAPGQIARGSAQVDNDGARQATLLFAPATSATLVMPNGSTLPAASLSVRATEFTVGVGGPAAMPGTLPPTSGYTYCVELSADEAIAAGAAEIRFNQPVAMHVENFLNFPVGGAVPTGYFDRQQGTWIAAPNGRVIKVLNHSGGLAVLDTNGDALGDDAPTLAALGITDLERQQLAGLYAAGQTLWRVPVTHFTPWDHNWPFGPPEDAESPGENGTEVTNNDTNVEDGCEASGSIIECENQVLGLRLPLVGTPYALNYRSNRVPGRNSARALRIRLSGSFVPITLKRIELKVNVAGRGFHQIFPAEPDQVTFFEWDGLDAYGRQPQGAQRASVQIGFVYDGAYQLPSSGARAFGQTGGAIITGDRGREEITVWSDYAATIGALDTRTVGLAGWNLSSHHLYDPATRDLYLGDGRHRSIGALARVVEIVAGSGLGSGFAGDGGPATEAIFNLPQGLAVGPDGSLFIADTANRRVRRVDPDGNISTFAGNGVEGYTGDGGPATQASFGSVRDVAVAPDGSVYINDDSRRIRRVGPDGTIHTVAGINVIGFTADGGPASVAALNGVRNMAVAPDGTLYFSEGGLRVRRIGTDGILTTVAGGDVQGFAGDGGPATQALFGIIGSIALGPDGSLFVADTGNRRVRRIGTDGIVTTVAGNGAFVISPDGIPAVDAGLRLGEITVGPDGVLYLFDGDFQNRRIRRVDLDGIITTVVGKTDLTPGFGNGGIPAGQVLMATSMASMVVGPDGNLYYLDPARLRSVAPPFPGTSASESVLVSEDATELYVFAATGRHLRTLHALTGATLMEFGYDSDGLLTEIIEKTGGTDNVTMIEHDTAGNPLFIVGPFGQRTSLTVDGNGFLASIANPADETVQLVSTATGLVTEYTDPRGHRSTYGFEPDGRLIQNTDPVGGGQELALAFTPAGFAVSRTTALGRTTTYEVASLADRVQQRVVTSPDGTQSISQEQLDAGTQTLAFGDGTIQSKTIGPDPRFGMQAPVAANFSFQLPSTLEFTVASTRAAELTNPADPLSLVRLTNTTTVNGRTATSIYTAATRTVVNTTAAGRVQTVTLDGIGRLVQAQRAGLEPFTIAYDNRGRIESLTVGSGGDARSYSMAYNPQGLLATITDPIGRTSLFSYNEADRVISETKPDGRVIAYDYDAAGNLTSLTPPGRPAHSFGYSDRNELTLFNPPSLPGAGTTKYDYNVDGATTKVTRPGNQTISIGFDSAGRPVTRTLATGGVSHGTDTFGYDGAGQLTDILTAGGVGVASTYDGPLRTGDTWSGPVTGNVTRTFDSSLRLAGQSVTGGNPVSFSYDDDNLLTVAGSLVIARDPHHGLPTNSTLGIVNTSFAYNRFGELTNGTVSVGGSPFYRHGYSRDALGRVAQKVEEFGGVSDTFAYTYDLAGQLTAVSKNGLVTESYGYDSNGNRTSSTVAGVTVSATYDDQDRLTQYGSTVFTYNGAGDLVSKTTGAQTTTYDYDPLGSLHGVALPGGSAISYLVDGRGRRVGKKVNGVLIKGFLYADSRRPIAELDAVGTPVSRYVYAGGNAPTYMIKGGVLFKLVTDQVGSVCLVINAGTGAVLQRMAYDAFGNVVLDTNPGFQPFGFAGGLYDPDTKLVRFGARDYDAETGRWTAKDPIQFSGRDANLYAYAFNDPVNFTDPTGMLAPIVIGVAAVAWGAIEFGLSATDFVEFFGDLVDPCVTGWEKAGNGLLLGAGIILPGGGYTKADDVARAAPGVFDKLKDFLRRLFGDGPPKISEEDRIAAAFNERLKKNGSKLGEGVAVDVFKRSNP